MFISRLMVDILNASREVVGSNVVRNNERRTKKKGHKITSPLRAC
jgi:hypothetical protein